MMDGEKRIVTFMGDAGRKTANIIWRDKIKMFEVECECVYNKETKFFTVESDAQAFAEKFVWEKQNGTI
jgi:hypothetical protein